MIAGTIQARPRFLILAGLLLALVLMSANPAAAQELPTATPALTPTTVVPARPAALEAVVLVERLRVRSGPDVNFPILERATVGQTLVVTGQSEACTWLQVLTSDGRRGWVSGDTGLLRLNVSCSRVPHRAVPTLAPTATETPLPTATRTSTPTRTPTPTRTATATPRSVPALSIRPLVAPPATPTPVRPRPTATPRALLPTPTTNPLAGLTAGGPTFVTQLDPPPGYVNVVRTVFSWQTDQPLAPGQLFEVAFWTRHQSPELGVGWTQATTEYQLAARLDEQIPGDYFWGVWLGAMVDGAYVRLRYLGGGNSLSIPGEEEPNAPPVNNCPPSAPCK